MIMALGLAPLSLAVQLSALAAPHPRLAGGADPCCTTCAPGYQHYYSIPGNGSECGLCCLQPKSYNWWKLFEPSLKFGTCANEGYTKYIGTETDGLGPMSVTNDRFVKPAVSGASDSTHSQAGCASVAPIRELNTTEFIRATWYVQQQQVTGYQPKDSLFCVVQTLEDEGKTVPFYSGKVITVYNYANLDEINGKPQNTANETQLCARQPNPADPARIINAPCFLPNILAGDYWVIAAGPAPSSLEWAIISAGPPTVPMPDGNCTTKTTGTNGAGLWLFTRQPTGAGVSILVNTMRKRLQSMGYSLAELMDVPQAGCNYQGALIKG